MNQENGLNHYQRFVGGSLESNRLSCFPIGRSEFLRFPVRNDGVEVVEASMHPVDLEFDAQFGHAVTLKGLVLLVVKVNGCQRRTLIGARDGQGGSRIAQDGAEVPVVRVVHPHRQVQ